MNDVWQTYQSRLAATLGQPQIPASSWRRRRASSASLSRPLALIDVHLEPARQFVRLPGIQRPECGPLPVRVR